MLVVIGEAPSQNINYYAGYNTITQNSAGDILFDCCRGYIDVFVSRGTYSVSFLVDEHKGDNYGMTYIGTLRLR